MGEALLVLDPRGHHQAGQSGGMPDARLCEHDLLGMSIGDVFEEEEGDAEAGAFMGTWLEALIRTGALSRIEARFIAKRRAAGADPLLAHRREGPDGRISDIICIAKDMTGYVRVEEDPNPPKLAHRRNEIGVQEERR
jgi:hypothetical protein